MASSHSNQQVSAKARVLLGVGFAFVSGWTDAVCLVRYNAFATMMTGNCFQLGYTLVYPSAQERSGLDVVPDTPFYILIILSYMSAIVLYRLAEGLLHPQIVRKIPLILALSIAVVELIDALQREERSGRDARWVVCCLAPVFAVQNTITSVSGLKTSVSFASGNIQKFSSTVATMILGEATKQEVRKSLVSISIVLSLILGAVCGAAFDYQLGGETAKWNLVPISPLLFVLFLINDYLFYYEPSGDAENLYTIGENRPLIAPANENGGYTTIS